MKALEVAAGKAQFSTVEFKRHKKLLGYCHTTNLMAGEYFAGCGDEQSAEREFLEIVRLEPDNPWGWLALGEFYAEEGRLSEAIESFSRLCELVPAHLPGYRALGELFRRTGDKKRSKQSLNRAKELLE
jgi:predicted Zn-dependent protease